jgi:HK97 family phage prohead protease
MRLETRQNIIASELRTIEDTPNRIVGYAAVFNSLSEDLGGFKERILPGAFKRTVKAQADVLALVGHQRGMILGRTSSGTLTLAEDDRGLRVTIDLPDTSYARDLRESIARRDISGMSFGFHVPENGDRVIEEDGQIIRELLDIDLHEVSVVTMPAYLATSAELRNIDPAIIAQVQAMQSSSNLSGRWRQLRHAMTA